MRLGGYVTITDPDRPLVEYDTVTCCHCGRLIFLKPGTAQTTYLVPDNQGLWKEEAGAGCWSCQKPVCLACEALGTCMPLERRLEQMEGRRLTGRLIAVP